MLAKLINYYSSSPNFQLKGMLAKPKVRGRYVKEILARPGLGAAKAAWVLVYPYLGEDHCSRESGSQLAVNSSVGFLRKATNAANLFGECDDEINARKPNKKRASSFELKKRVLKIQVRVTAEHSLAKTFMLKRK
ncbi:hypothetical protein VNO77_27052 [Canavalia gladiata]|uniref:Uncharacterized protein n=1 Tax=Canavalia gladiata TaxID=3824 RepID=A0AAN9KTF6_CANGL